MAENRHKNVKKRAMERSHWLLAASLAVEIAHLGYSIAISVSMMYSKRHIRIIDPTIKVNIEANNSFSYSMTSVSFPLEALLFSISAILTSRRCIHLRGNKM
jgi:hypothetical protein